MGISPPSARVVNTHIHIHAHTQTHSNTHTRTRTYTHTNTHARTLTCMYVRTHTHENNREKHSASSTPRRHAGNTFLISFPRKFVVHHPIAEGLLHNTAKDCKAILAQGTFDHILRAYEPSDPDALGLNWLVVTTVTFSTKHHPAGDAR